MISFRLNEIPKGFSERFVLTGTEELGIDQSEIKKVKLQLRFNKQDEHIRIECHMVAEAILKCDRSLDLFETELVGDYEVVFQINAKTEREDLSGAIRHLNPSQNVINITKEIRDTVLLSIPVKKLHPRYYSDGEITDFEANFGSTEEEYDSRWNELKKLKQNFNTN